MSEPIPESIPTSADPRSKRPTKRRALSPSSKHATQVDALFAKPDRELVIPSSETLNKKKNLPPPPEIVANVQGSSAGAGSGEFHVYKASRRREYERLKMMDEDLAKEKGDADFEARQAERKKKDEDRTNKNRKKRERLKAKKEKRNGAGAAGLDDEQDRPQSPDQMMREPLAQSNEVHSTHVAEAADTGVIIHDDD